METHSQSLYVYGLGRGTFSFPVGDLVHDSPETLEGPSVPSSPEITHLPTKSSQEISWKVRAHKLTVHTAGQSPGTFGLPGSRTLVSMYADSLKQNLFHVVIMPPV